MKTKNLASQSNPKNNQSTSPDLKERAENRLIRELIWHFTTHERSRKPCKTKMNTLA